MADDLSRFTTAARTALKTHDAVFVEVVGAKELVERLKGLPNALAKKLERSSLRVAGKIVLAAVKANTPVDTGAGQASWKLRAIKRSRRFPGRIGVQVVSSATGHLFKGKQFYLAFLEFGAPGHQHFGRPGRPLPPLGFVKRATTQSKAAAIAAFRTDLQGRIAAVYKQA